MCSNAGVFERWLQLISMSVKQDAEVNNEASISRIILLDKFKHVCCLLKKFTCGETDMPKPGRLNWFEVLSEMLRTHMNISLKLYLVCPKTSEKMGNDGHETLGNINDCESMVPSKMLECMAVAN